MAQPKSISAVDRALKNFLWRAIETEASLKNVISDREQIVFSSPKTTRKVSKVVSVFLLNIAAGEDGATESTYFITPSLGSELDDHLLLEMIMRQTSAAQKLEQTEEEPNTRRTVRLKSVSLKELTELWGAIGTTLKPSICLIVTATENKAPSRSGVIQASPQPAVIMQKTVQLYQAVFKTFIEQTEGWAKRNIFLRQWVTQDFRKVTNLSPDEMLAALNRLGDKLARAESTDQFVEPLRKLTKYYGHQLNELKGMQKVSHNQSENIELIVGWAKDVNALIEALNPEPVSGKEHKPT